jgi:membrane peptidoglycan carboxypeptidase
MYGVVRRYTGASALSKALKENEDDVRQLLSSVKGFVAYYAVQSGDSVATITICQDAQGTAESTRRAAEWVKERNISIGSGAAPQVTEGKVYIRIP